eukprot:PhM_4_TR11333/c0_g1_i1/m.103943
MKLASTVLLCAPRKASPSTYELLLVKRHSKARFFANAYVFPGGVVEDSDFAFQRQHIPQGNDRTVVKIAALRELTEETGITITPDGATTTTTAAPPTSTLIPPLYRLHTFARWVTPEPNKYRYDTYFFVCLLPKPAEDLQLDVVLQASEVAGYKWLTPREAVELHDHDREASGVRLPPPTYLTMLELMSIGEDMTSLSKYLSEVHPKIVDEDGRELVIPRQSVLKKNVETNVVRKIMLGDKDHPLTKEYVGRMAGAVVPNPEIVTSAAKFESLQTQWKTTQHRMFLMPNGDYELASDYMGYRKASTMNGSKL